MGHTLSQQFRGHLLMTLNDANDFIADLFKLKCRSLASLTVLLHCGIASLHDLSTFCTTYQRDITCNFLIIKKFSKL